MIGAEWRTGAAGHCALPHSRLPGILPNAGAGCRAACRAACRAGCRAGLESPRQGADAPLSAPFASRYGAEFPNQPHVRYSHTVTTFRMREAAALLGVSYDTMRRWADSGLIEEITDESGRLAVDGAALARFAQERADSAGPTDEVPSGQSLRNRFTGLVTRVVKDTVMAQVEIQAGPHRFVSLLSREAADELGLEPGVLAVAAVKSTNVSVEVPRNR